MMTNKQHDDLWMAAFGKVPELANSVRRANVLAIAKEMYSLGEMTKEEYINTLKSILKSEGYTMG